MVLRPGIAVIGLLLPISLQAAATNLVLSNSAALGTFNLSAPTATSIWSNTTTGVAGAVPTNGDNAFIVFTGSVPIPQGGSQAVFTNAPSNVFVADSLTVSNMAGSDSGGTLTITFSGPVYFTSGVAQVNFDPGGGPDPSRTSLTFSNNVTFGAMKFIATNSPSGGLSAGQWINTFTLAGTSQGNSFLFNGSGNLSDGEQNYLIISGALGLTGTLTITNLGLIYDADLGGGYATISGNSTVGNVIFNNPADTGAGSVAITSSTMLITGAVASVAGGFNLANNATITLSGGGGLIISNVAPLLNGTLNIGNQTVTGKTNWSNNGTVTLAGGYIVGNNLTNSSGATLLGYGNLSNVVVNLGTIWVTNNTLAFASNIVQGGTVTISSGSTLSVLGSGALANHGTINLVGAGAGANAILNLGTVAFTNLSGGTITGGGIIQNASQVVNLSGGSILATSTVVELQFTNANTVANTGTMGATTGATLTFGTATVGSAIISNAGTINLTGGTLKSGNITNLAAGAVLGSGTITGNLINGGSVTATNGNLQLSGAANGAGTYRAVAGASAATLTFAGGGSISALFDTSATVRVQGVLTNASLFVNTGSLAMGGGTYQSAANLTNAASGRIVGTGTVAASVFNSGTILANSSTAPLALTGAVLVNQVGGVITANVGRLIVSGAFTNAGTLSMMNSIGTFASAVVNSGAWITDPTTNVFQNTYTVTSSGFIQSSAGDLYVFSNNATTAASFINISTNKTQYNTLNGDFQFANTLGVTQVFATAGHDVGPPAATATNQIEVFSPNAFSLPEYSNNFALGTLDISSFTTVMVDDAFITGGPGTNDNLEAALYLNNLDMGVDSLLIISSNVVVYFIDSNNWSLANVQLQGNPNYNQTFDGIHQFVVVPEPAIVLLWLSSIVTVCAARRRNARSSPRAAGRS
jgi:fibronectin-binding autotransporter adhesin